jgi:hypothetical protein
VARRLGLETIRQSRWAFDLASKCRTALPAAMRAHVRKRCQVRRFRPDQQRPDRTLRLVVTEEKDCRFDWLRRAAEQRGLGLEFIEVRRDVLSRPVVHHMQPFIRPGTSIIDRQKPAERTEDYAVRFEAMVRHYRSLTQALIETYRPHAVLSASLGDIRWTEFGRVARQMGLPWIVAEREGVLAPAIRDKHLVSVKTTYDPECDLMCLSNPVHRDYWKQMQVRGAQYALTGELNSDFWAGSHLWRSRRELLGRDCHDKKILLYFAFGPKNYLANPLSGDLFPGERRDWTDLQIQHCRAIRALLDAAGDDVIVIVKVGHSSDLLCPEAKRFLPDRPNVHWEPSREVTLDWIVNADAILGMQTTAMIESMFVDVPLIYGGWGGLHEDVIEQLLPIPSSGGVLVPGSEGELVEMLRAMVEDPASLAPDAKMLAARRKFREEYFWQPDGKAGQRTLEAILTFLERRNDPGCFDSPRINEATYWHKATRTEHG